MDKEEIDYWCEEYPGLTREEVIEVLEIIELTYNDKNKQGNKLDRARSGDIQDREKEVRDVYEYSE